MGSIIGGLITDSVGVANIGYVGCVFVLGALAITAVYLIPRMRLSPNERYADA